MTDREKIIEVIKKAFEDCGRMLKEQIPRVFSGEIKKASDGTPPLDEAIADALIVAGFRDINDRGKIFMNGEAIVPTPVIYNKVAELLGCPLMSGVLPDEVKVFDDGTFGNEDKHRAEVAKLALKKACRSIARILMWERCNDSDPLAVEDLQRFYLNNAEWHLREEAKK